MSAKFWFALVALSGSCSLAQAATYYVSPSGNDSNTGARSAPFLHISKGAAVANAGDTVIVMNGVYGSEGQCANVLNNTQGLGSVVVLANSGNATAGPITFRAQNRGGAILDGSLGVVAGNCGFTVSPYICNEAWSYFDLAQNSVSYITIDGFVIQNTCVNAIHANSSSSSMRNIVISHNEIRYIGNTWDSVDEKGCGAFGCGANGIFIPIGPSNFTFDSNTWHDIGHGPGTGQQSAIDSAASDSIIVNNIFYNLPYGLGILDASGSNLLIANNTFEGASPGGQLSLWDGNGPFSGLTIENNIFDTPNGTGISIALSSSGNLNGCAIDYNVTSASTLFGDSTQPSNCTVGSHNQTSADPGFVSTGSQSPTYDFHLATASSPAIGAGLYLSQITHDCDGNTRPSGAATDVGACIFTGDYASDLQGWWTLNQTANDSSGNSYNGAGQGSPAPAYAGGHRADTDSISLNGQNQYIGVPASTPNLNMTDNLTVAFWVNPDELVMPRVERKIRLQRAVRSDPQSIGGVVAKNDDWDVRLTDGVLQFLAEGTAYRAVTSNTIPSESWTHVAIAYASGGNSVVTVYINGTAVTLSESNFPSGFQLGSNDLGLNIGAQSDAQAGFLSGSIDDVRIYNRVLTATEVQALYRATSH